MKALYCIHCTNHLPDADHLEEQPSEWYDIEEHDWMEPCKGSHCHDTDGMNKI